MSEVRRVLRTRLAARRAYDRMSSIYDWLTAGEAYMRRRLLRVAAIRRGEKVLDLGTGTGAALGDLVDSAGPEGLVLGLDLSPRMLARARRKIAGEAALVRGDAAALPFASGSVDVLVMSFSLELFDTPEIPQVLAEGRRILGEQGRLVVGSLASRPARNAVVRAYEWLHDRWPAWLDCRPIPVRTLLMESGFRLETVEEGSLWGLPVDLAVARWRR